MAHSLNVAEELPRFGRRHGAVFISIREACELGQSRRQPLDLPTVAGIAGAIAFSATVWMVVGLAVFRWMK
jgi:hypothetical protein